LKKKFFSSRSVCTNTKFSKKKPRKDPLNIKKNLFLIFALKLPTYRGFMVYK
jgi:hypothetical protein